MKKLILWILVFCCFGHTKAQGGELQFSETKIFTKTIGLTKHTSITGIPPTSTIVEVDTSYLFWDSITVIVPPNKTLKIENVSLGGLVGVLNQDGASNYTSLSYTKPHRIICYNGIRVFLFNAVIYESLYQGGHNESFHTFPIWLPSGTYQFVIFGDPQYAHTNNNGIPLHSNAAKEMSTAKVSCFMSALEFNIIP